MKLATKHAATAGILFGIGLYHFQKAVMITMADDICRQSMVVFQSQSTGKETVFKKVTKAVELMEDIEEDSDEHGDA